MSKLLRGDLVRGIVVGAMPEQWDDGIIVAPHHCKMQRRVAILVHRLQPISPTYIPYAHAKHKTLEPYAQATDITMSKRNQMVV
jgi:hypothetical protein